MLDLHIALCNNPPMLLKTPEQVIDELGGASALADEMKLKQPTVSSWVLRGRIPAEYADKLRRRIKPHKILPAIFGMVK